MKRIISIILTLSAFALLLASCGKELMPWEGRSRAIKLIVEGVADTKASIYTTNGLSSFYLSAYATRSWRKDSIGQSTPLNDPGLYKDPVGGYLQGVNVKKDGSSWVLKGNENESSPSFSWINDVTMNFFAYAPSANSTASDAAKGSLAITKANTGTASITANFPFTYAAKVPSTTTTPIESGDCDDLIFAYASNKVIYESDNTSADFGKLKSGSESINIIFYHALAQIRFCVDPAEFTDIKLISAKLLGPKDTSDPTKYVGIASKGDCTFTGPSSFSWNSSTLASRYAYSQTFNGTSGVSFASGVPTGWTSKNYTSPVARTIYTCEGDVILLIPQTLTDCGVEVTIQVGSETPVLLQGKLPATNSSSTNVSWDAGYYYTYKIGTTGTQEDLSLTMTLVDWAERESYIPIN